MIVSADKKPMKKLILCLPLFFTSLSFAQDQDYTQILKQLQKINSKPVAVDAECNTCDADAMAKSVGPQNAVEQVFSGKLTFVGRDLFPGSDQNRTCVYKTDTAYVLYHNCMSSKKEAVATDIDIIDFNGGITHFYIENKESSPISEMKRSNYSSTWTVDFKQSAPPGNLNMAGLKNYMDSHSAMNSKSGACFVGGSFKAQDMSVLTQCYGPIKSSPVAQQWGEAADEFWREPGSKWYDALKLLRKTVVATKF